VEDEIDAKPCVQECWNDLRRMGVIENDATLADYLQVDEDLVIADYPTDVDIFDSVVREEGQIEEDLEGDEPEEGVAPCPSKQEVLHEFQIFRRGV